MPLEAHETGGDINKLSDDELLKARDYVYGTYKGLPYLRKLEAEIKNRGLGNPNYLEDWKKEDRSIPKSFFRGEKLDEIWDRFYKDGEEQSESPDQPFTLRRYIKDKSYSQLPTEIRGNTINLAQQGQEAKQPIGLRSMGKYKYVESGKISRSKEKKHDHICEKLKNTVWEMSDTRRPILPSEGLGITNTHPHCKCIWETYTEVETEPSYVGHTLRPTLNGRSLEEFGWK